MRLSFATTRNGLLALTAIAALSISAPAAFADRGNGRGHGKDKSYGQSHGRGGGYSRGGGYTRGGTVRYRAPQRTYSRQYIAPQRYYAPRRSRASVRIGIGYSQPYYARPVVYQACPPRYVTYRPQHVVIVRPAPYVRIGARFGCVDISAILGPRRIYSDYDYGCNFCEAHFSSYDSYQDHVQGCSHRPANVRIQCERWDESGYDDYRASGDDDRGGDRYDEGRRYDDDDDRGDYRGNDGYDDRDDRGDYDDGR